MASKALLIKNMKAMMVSIFTYGELEPTDSYLDDYRNKLTDAEFNEVFTTHSKYLSDTYYVVEGCFTDRDGCTYNELIPFNK